MSLPDEWERPYRDRRSGVADAGMGALRIALLFGSAAVALALILTPLMNSQTRTLSHSAYPTHGLDMMATGTVGQRNPVSYTVRRSVLQPSPNSVCIIRENGMRTGDC